MSLGKNLAVLLYPVTTPFTADFDVDYDALKKLMRFYLKNDLRCFIAAGSTGQCYVLREDEHRRVVRTIVEECKSYEGCFVLGACADVMPEDIEMWDKSRDIL